MGCENVKLFLRKPLRRGFQKMSTGESISYEPPCLPVNHIRTKIIACKTLIGEIQPLLPANLESFILESGLHLHPEKLRSALQALIDEITVEAEVIILGYGLCSMGVMGLRATHSTLVIPRQDDCVGIFLGSRRVYKKELDREAGTFFLSKGWIDAGITPLDELKRMEKQYGRRRAELIMNRMFQNYRRLAFIDMGYQNQERYRQYARMTAKKLDLYYEEIRGTPELLGKICNGPWDDEFVVAPPGDTIRLEHFGMAPAKGQEHSSTSLNA